LVKLINVRKKFDEIIALDQISLSVEDGEYLCILGPTGAGKTTLLRTIAGLVNVDEGEIYIEGRLANKTPPEERNAVYMFQQYALFPHMTVWQNVSFGPTIDEENEDEIKKKTSQILRMVRLEDRSDAFPNELSGGMQQRIALARGIASGARILLLDEPLGALDARLRVDLRSQLRKLAKDQDLTTIHVTHDQEEALMIADRVVVIRDGKIEQIGDPQDIYSNPRSIFVASFVGGANFIEGFVVDLKENGSVIEIRDGYQIRIADKSKKLDEKVVIAVRFEKTSVDLENLVGVNAFPGKIKSAVFVVDSMEYEIELNGVIVSSKIMLSDNYRAYKPGEDVVVSFSPENCYLFSYPKVGLLKEIEAI